jgi:hypothetical protein
MQWESLHKSKKFKKLPNIYKNSFYLLKKNKQIDRHKKKEKDKGLDKSNKKRSLINVSLVIKKQET